MSPQNTTKNAHLLYCAEWLGSSTRTTLLIRNYLQIFSLISFSCSLTSPLLLHCCDLPSSVTISAIPSPVIDVKTTLTLSLMSIHTWTLEVHCVLKRKKMFLVIQNFLPCKYVNGIFVFKPCCSYLPLKNWKKNTHTLIHCLSLKSLISYFNNQSQKNYTHSHTPLLF